MEIDDFVETSDVEELQELEEENRRALLSSRTRHDSFSSYHSPTKRVKLYHEPLNDDDESTGPYFASPVLSDLKDDSPVSSSPHYSSPPPPPEVAPEPPEVIQEQLLDGPRYSLRRRNAAQLKPYTIDQLKYKQALRANPDAIVKFKNLALRNHHYHPEDRYEEEEDGETQMDAYVDDGNNEEERDWEERERRRRQRREEDRRKETLNQALPDRTQMDGDIAEDENDESGVWEEREKRRHRRREEGRRKGTVNDEGDGSEERERTRDQRCKEGRRMEILDHALPDQTQVDAYIDEGRNDDGGDGEDMDRVPHQKREETPKKENLKDTSPDPQPISYPEILQDLSSTDDHSQSKQSDSSDMSDPAEIQLPRSKQRALARMFPKSMAFALVKQAATSSTTKKHRRSSTPPASGSDNDEGPLLPGHTRIRKATNLRSFRDIKGDSESEQEIEDDLDTKSLASPQKLRRISVSDSSSGSDEVEFVQHRRRTPIVDLVSDSGTSSEDEMDDLTIQSHIADSHTPFSPRSACQSGSGRLRDGSLIDWMLTRTRRIGGKRRERKKDGSGQKRAKSKKRGYRPQNTSTVFGAASHSQPSIASYLISAERDDEDDQVLDRDHRKLSWKEREKVRRARAKKQGLYTFASKGQTHIKGGRKETVFITVDLQDEGFHYALAPQQDRTQTQNWATIFKPIPEPSLAARSRDKTCSGDADQQALTVKPKKKKQERIIPGDLGIPLLHSGKSFGLSTSIRKGWLHELLGSVTSTQEPVFPPSINSCGFELGPTMGADKLISIFPDICSTLFEFVTDLPDLDSDGVIKGAVIMRVVPLLISWFRKTGDEGVSASLREAGEREIACLVAKIQKLTLPVVDMPILATCWFAVEISARLGCRLEGQPPTGILKESAMTLIHLLLHFGLEKAITVVKSDTDMTESVSVQAYFAAELWVSLIHLLGECDSLEKANRHIHPFWLLLMTAIQTRPEGQKPQTNLEASETIWYTIFSVCAFSQYSVHGMTTGVPRLPACWEFVVFALKKIRLNEDPKTDLGMPSAMLLQRDKYIGLVMTRCFHLRERWRWKLDDASVLFNQLAVIFRSRKFINLRHEGAGYPKFFKDRNWDLLASYDPKDTAFILFIKLIVQAAKDDQGGIQGKLSLKTKKLLSLAVPVASLPFSKTNPPTLHELTMFHNRLSAVAIAVYLERDEYDFRTRQAREYIKFADADDTTRSAVIGGMMNWAIMMVNRDIKLDAIAIWIEEMAQVLYVEVKETNDSAAVDELNKTKSLPRDRLILLSCVLLGAVRHILTAYIDLGRYPEPSLLSSLKPIIHSLFNKEDSKAQGELGLLTDTFFSARSAAIPPPSRPIRAPARVVDEDNGEESQDYGVMDIEINWASVDIPEALAADNEGNLSSSHASHDKTLLTVLTNLGLKWTMYRFLKPYFVPPSPSVLFQVYAKQCDMWLRCVVWCICMEIRDHKWDFWFGVFDPHLTQIDDRWVRRVKLSLMLKILRADPMTYQTHMDRFIDVYLHALGSDSTVLEKDYVPFLLSIDNLQHPLLCNAQCLPERSQESGDYEFTAEQLLELRLPLFRVVFSNLDRLLHEQQAGNVELGIVNDQYLVKCREVFSVMRSTRASLEGTKHYSDYNNFCIKVFQSLQEYPTLRVAKNIPFWVDLGRASS